MHKVGIQLTETMPAKTKIMNAEYFHARVCVELARYAREMLESVTYHGTAMDAVCEALESGTDTTDSFVSATRALVETFWNDVAMDCVVNCMMHQKTARKNADIIIDRTNIQIHHGYPNDVFILCGGLEPQK